MTDDRFDAGQLLSEARRAAGLQDFGGPDFRDGLDALIGIVADNPFTEQGRVQHRDRLVQLLTTRLQIDEAFRRHPEIRQRPLRAPMILTGLPRSGTSALFNLLAVDPSARPLLMWEALHPDPNWDLAPGETDPRHEALKELADAMRRDNPDFTKAHFFDADMPEECVLVQAFALDGGQLGYELLLEPYASWFQTHDLRPLYRYYADLLRLLDWQRPGERWLLKSPAHLWAIDVVAELFPDACIVWNHRDPAICVASIASMIHLLAADLVEATPEELGPLVLDHYAASMERALRHRDLLGSERFVDIDYDGIERDPLGEVAKAYAHADLDLAPLLPAMEQHIADHPKGKHGTHEYDLATFGLTRDAVRERFADYVDRFGL